MTVTFATLFNLSAAELIETGGFEDGDGNLIFTGTGGLPVIDYSPFAVQTTGGTVAELARTSSGYSSVASILAEFSGSDGLYPSSIIADANGDLFGVAEVGGPYYSTAVGNRGYGAVFEIARTTKGYADVPTVIAGFSGTNGVSPNSLVMDDKGDLFGTTLLTGTSGGGTVFEIAKTGAGYSSAPFTLASFFSVSASITEVSGLLIDQSGDLFGIAAQSSGTSAGIFELTQAAGIFASAPKTLATFSPAAGMSGVSVGNIVLDAAGDLFGVIAQLHGGTVRSEAVFEIAKTAGGYASAAVTLATLSSSATDLIVDSKGDLFFVSSGAVSEIASTAGVHDSAPTTVYSFTAATGSPESLFADDSGTLFGVTSGGGGNGKGIVFEIGGSGYTLSAAGAVADLQTAVTSPIDVGDSAADVLANLNGLATLAKAGDLASIALSDGGIPTLTLTSAQLAADQAALADISGSYVLSVAVPSTSVVIAGEAGHATILSLSGSAASHSITPDGDGIGFALSDETATDQISGVTALHFSDYTVFVASQTPIAPGGISSAQVATLYAGVLARAPDAAGLAYYEAAAAADPSVPIVTYAQDFLSSPEYVSNSAHDYPLTPAGDADFITATYGNLLHRAPGPTDVAWYQANVVDPFLAGLMAGTAAYADAELKAHAAVLADFCQSAEFLSDVAVTAAHPADAQHWLVLI